uniref:NADH-ubiquinone oxidoreductase chain 5 n=1 Tax=Pimpla luctuosa TaxID=495389 RepID=A0A3S8V127_9HYME|nr:NADH dehydrogenase subunit 5 [Pimpla luctuosa]
MIFYMMMMYLFIMMIFFFFLFLYLFMNKMIIFIEWEMLSILSMKMEFILLMDWMSMLFSSVVLMISLMVILYSIEYMIEDLNIERFMYLIILFVLSMILMILSPNMVSILIGWDGLGLVSYSLVIFYQNESSFNSGMVTVLTNRVGDIMILLLIGLMISLGSWNFMFINKMNMLMMLMLFISAITKSAQIPFSSWLPMAMAAPTPVSSLVHSSTLVTAGVYLLIRFNNLMLNHINLMKFMMIISVITMLLSGLGANFEFDLKKIIALSTLSQLGLMIFCLSLGLKEISFFHLLTHAMFKSMLFMCAGVIIHNMLGNQDIRMISMVMKNLPMISMLFNCSSLSLCGIPFMSGFFSKDLILEKFMMSSMNLYIFCLVFMSMGLTIMYTVRLMYYGFMKFSNCVLNYNYKSYSNKMGISMFMLFFMSIIIGSMLSWMLFSMNNLIYLPEKLKFIIFYFMSWGLFFGYFMPKLLVNNYFLIFMNLYLKFFTSMWFMHYMYGYKIKNLYKISNKIFFKVELGYIEYMFGFNLIKFFNHFYKMDFYYKSIMKMLIILSYLMYNIVVCI